MNCLIDFFLLLLVCNQPPRVGGEWFTQSSQVVSTTSRYFGNNQSAVVESLFCSSESTSHEFTGSLPPVLVLDIDGTIYDDLCAIESQIRDRSHGFAASIFGLNKTASQLIFASYGSLVKAVLDLNLIQNQTIFDSEDSIASAFYRSCYEGLNMFKLSKYSSGKDEIKDCIEMVATAANNQLLTGYDQNLAHIQSLADVHRALNYLSRHIPIVVASNSPSQHVNRILQRLGMGSLKIALYITPDNHQRPFLYCKNDLQFWDSLFISFPRDKFSYILLDDRPNNLKIAETLGMKTMLVNNSISSLSLPQAMARFLQDPWLSTSATKFIADEEYLMAKNAHDKQAYNVSVAKQVRSLIENRTEICVLDLGAGVGSMIPHILSLYNFQDRRQKQQRHMTYLAFEGNSHLRGKLLETLRKMHFKIIPHEDDSVGSASAFVVSRGEFTKTSVDVVVVFQDFMSSSALTTTKSILSKYNIPSHRGIDVVVGSGLADLFSPAKAFVSRLVEFTDIQRSETKADLNSSAATVVSPAGPLIYFPITFSGKTYIRHSISSEDSKPNKLASSRAKTIAMVEGRGDALMFPAYHHALQRRGHNLDIAHLLTTMEDFGGKLLARGRSDWFVSSKGDPKNRKTLSSNQSRTMWQALLNFLKLSIITVLGDDSVSASWRTKQFSRDILGDLRTHKEWWEAVLSDDFSWQWIAENEDLLFQFPSTEPISATALTDASNLSSSKEQEEKIPTCVRRSFHRTAVMFQGQKTISLTTKPLSLATPDQIVIDTECSMVSAGTELKIYRGDVLDEDVDEPIDVTIKALKQQAGWQYPMEYGYSLVGRVAAFASSNAIDIDHDRGRNNVDSEGSSTTSGFALKIGQRVFAFAPHATANIVDAASVQIVPDDVAAADAVFLPSVETALSLVMSAKIGPGDKVLVVGQGLVGLLTAAVVRLSHGAVVTSLTVAEVSALRLQESRKFFQALFPIQSGDSEDVNTNDNVYFWNPALQDSRSTKDFDVVIEVSGRKAGLSTALGHIRYGGRLVVGSWYAPTDTTSALPLGAKFHRSGITIVTSQVSRIPGEWQDRFSKQRRFDVCWPLIRRLRPSRLFQSQNSEDSGNASDHKPVTYDLEEEKQVQTAFQRLEAGKDITVLLRGPAYQPEQL